MSAPAAADPGDCTTGQLISAGLGRIVSHGRAASVLCIVRGIALREFAPGTANIASNLPARLWPRCARQLAAPYCPNFDHNIGDIVLQPPIRRAEIA